MGYVELQVTTNFTFLKGASHAAELVDQAALLGHKAIAITDRNTFAGIVRAHIACKKRGLRLIPGCRLDLLDGTSLLAYPMNRDAYGRLSTLLTQGNARAADKGKCHLYKRDLHTCKQDIQWVVVPPEQLTSSYELDVGFQQDVREYIGIFGSEYLSVGCVRTYSGDDAKKMFRINELCQRLGLPMVALNDIHYHIPERRELQDILTCIREKCTINTAGFRLHYNAERYLKSQAEMERLFRSYPGAIEQTQRIAESCGFSLDELHYVYPEELTTEGRTPQEELEKLTWEGAHTSFDGNIPSSVQQAIHKELAFIARKNYASYFLTVHDYVRFARSRGILCQGRGSAANSTVCYCLGITAVNPGKFRLLFARFMSDARNEPPDIDVDFEHERREEVIQYIYEKFGRDRAAIVATVTQVRAKGAIRDVGKAMGLSLDAVGKLSAMLSSYWDNHIEEDRLREHGFDPSDPHLQKTLSLIQQYIGFPRQLGQHTGGFVITQGKLHELCPIIPARMEGRTNLEWNKDDLEALGFLKVDVLALGMLTSIHKAFDLIRNHYGKELTLANIPQDDPKVYDMISQADTIGVFQIESRAQMSMLPRLKPKEFYDLVIEVAIVRPGPIQGDMVHPYLRRRNGEEPVEYPSEEIRSILKKTLGVPLFQEQAMEIAMVAANFSEAEADELRRSMATFKAKGEVSQFQTRLVQGMVKRGYSEDFALRVFRQLEGFGSYGFPESHAASFALLVYISAWLKCYYPDVFTTSLLNSQPMGFYQPAQLVIDAERHGVKVLPVDVNFSDWDHKLEGEYGVAPHAIRLGFRLVKGVLESDMQRLLLARETRKACKARKVRETRKVREAPEANMTRKVGMAQEPDSYSQQTSFEDCCYNYSSVTELADVGVSVFGLERLADADAFGSLRLDRRKALWEVSALKDRLHDLFLGQPSGAALTEQALHGQISLPLMRDSEQVLQDYVSMALSVKAHPLKFLREKLDLLHVTESHKLGELENGSLVKVCGLITVRQRPGTAKGVLFVTIEDETGVANLVIWGKLFDKYRKEILQSRLLLVSGRVQIEGQVIHVIVEHCVNLNAWLSALGHADSSNKDVFDKGRNFK